MKNQTIPELIKTPPKDLPKLLLSRQEIKSNPVNHL